MGEWSKKLGDHGEDIVGALLNLIGWNSALASTDIACVKPAIHGSAGRPRRTHGIDFIFSSPSPLEDGVLKHLVISSKFTADLYPSAPTSKFKEHFSDLAVAVECFKRSDIKRKINASWRDVSSDNVVGVLFWISASDRSDKNIVSGVSNARGLEDCSFGTIYVIDNYRASFLFESISFATRRYGKDCFDFVYPSTGKNLGTTTRVTSGRMLPPEYLNSGVMLLCASGGNNKSLLICCQDPFGEGTLKRLMGFAMTIALHFPDEVSIAFPDYDFVKETLHK